VSLVAPPGTSHITSAAVNARVANAAATPSADQRIGSARTSGQKLTIRKNVATTSSKLRSGEDGLISSWLGEMRKFLRIFGFSPAISFLLIAAPDFRSWGDAVTPPVGRPPKENGLNWQTSRSGGEEQRRAIRFRSAYDDRCAGLYFFFERYSSPAMMPARTGSRLPLRAAMSLQYFRPLASTSLPKSSL
jgi:hypothetical protein